MTLDCRTCGACCINPPINREADFPWWVEIANGDRILDRADLVREHVVYDADGVPHLRLAADGRCLALRGTLNRNASCAIYSERPTSCRTVQPGDALCLRYRHEHGLT
jgi:Fe-S-cluster containining protein